MTPKQGLNKPILDLLVLAAIVLVLLGAGGLFGIGPFVFVGCDPRAITCARAYSYDLLAILLGLVAISIVIIVRSRNVDK